MGISFESSRRWAWAVWAYILYGFTRARDKYRLIKQFHAFLLPNIGIDRLISTPYNGKYKPITSKKGKEG